MKAFAIVGEPFRKSLYRDQFFESLRRCNGRNECFQAVYKDAKGLYAVLVLSAITLALLIVSFVIFGVLRVVKRKTLRSYKKSYKSVFGEKLIAVFSIAIIIFSIILVAFSLKLIKTQNPFKEAQALVPQVETKVENGNEALNGLWGLKSFAIESLLGPNLLQALRSNAESIKSLLANVAQIPNELKQELDGLLDEKKIRRVDFKVDTKALSKVLDKYRDVWRSLVLGESLSGMLLTLLIFLFQVFLLIAVYAKVPPKTFLSLCLGMMLLGAMFTVLYASLITSAAIIGGACESSAYETYKKQVKECVDTDNAMNLLRINDYGLCRQNILSCDLPKSIKIKEGDMSLRIQLPNSLEGTLNGTRKFVDGMVEPQLEQLALASKEVQPLLEQAKALSPLLPFNVSLLEDAFGNVEKLESSMNDKIGALIRGNLKTALECRQLGMDAQHVIDSACKTTLSTIDEMHSVAFLVCLFVTIQTVLLLFAVWIASKGQRQKFPTNLFTSFFE